MNMLMYCACMIGVVLCTKGANAEWTSLCPGNYRPLTSDDQPLSDQELNNRNYWTLLRTFYNLQDLSNNMVQIYNEYFLLAHVDMYQDSECVQHLIPLVNNLSETSSFSEELKNDFESLVKVLSLTELPKIGEYQVEILSEVSLLQAAIYEALCSIHTMSFQHNFQLPDEVKIGQLNATCEDATREMRLLRDREIFKQLGKMWEKLFNKYTALANGQR